MNTVVDRIRSNFGTETVCTSLKGKHVLQSSNGPLKSPIPIKIFSLGFWAQDFFGGLEHGKGRPCQFCYVLQD